MNLFKKEKKEVPVSKDTMAVVRKEVLPPVTAETVTSYMETFGIGKGLMPHELEAFKQMAIMHNLNPFNRDIYCVAYGEGDRRTLSILTGYEVYIKKAEQSGLMEYWVIDDAPPETPIEKYWAKIIIKRQDRAKEQAWTVFYSEGVQKDRYGKVNSFWQKQPRMMTKKVAMSQGFRLFFEDVMHGIPYTREEMPEDKGGMTDVTPMPKAKDITKETTLPDWRDTSAGETSYEESKEKVIEENNNRIDPILPEKPKDKPQETPSVPNFSAIIALVNGKGIPNEDKVKILSAARACNKDEGELAIVLKNVKNEYNL